MISLTEGSPSIGIIIPTYKPPHDQLTKLLKKIQQSLSDVLILVIDSSSNDGTVEIAEKLGVATLVIPQVEFNHGATREYARQYLGTDIVVMLTQDVSPVGTDFLEKLLQPLLSNDSIAVTYARQVARHGAGILESFPREYNYGEQSYVRSIKDINEYGVHTFFSSDSCAAYRSSCLNEIGGFQPVLTSEDYFAVARLLIRGYEIAYVAESVVIHSHAYTLRQEFQRYFDTGYVRAEHPFVQELVGSAETRGVGFIHVLLSRLIKEAPLMIPYAAVQTGVKFLGYRTGFSLGRKLPDRLKVLLSMQSFYWRSNYYKQTQNLPTSDGLDN